MSKEEKVGDAVSKLFKYKQLVFGTAVPVGHSPSWPSGELEVLEKSSEPRRKSHRCMWRLELFQRFLFFVHADLKMPHLMGTG